jgi:hypothetical protein
MPAGAEGVLALRSGRYAEARDELERAAAASGAGADDYLELGG